jgi:hypothetical protein
MTAMEQGEYTPRTGMHLRTRFGILGSKVGAGKTVTLCALIKSTQDDDPRDRLPRHTTYGTSTLVIRQDIASDSMSRVVVSGCSLIIVPHGLQFQWEGELKDAGIDFCRHDTFDPAKPACLVTATKLATFWAAHPHIHFKRVIIDEADTITIRRQPDLRTSFIWFVSATYHDLEAAWRLHNSRPMFYKCFRQFAALQLDLNDVTVRSQPDWVDACNNLPNIEVAIITCAMPAYMNVVLGTGLSPSIAEMLSAGDVEGAILAMGGAAQTERNIVDVVTARITEDIRRLEARAAYFDQIHSLQAAAHARQSIETKVQQLASISQRLASLKEDGTCPICLEQLGLDTKQVLLASCCGHLFCGACLMAWRCRGNACPMCRSHDFSVTLIKDEQATTQAPQRLPRPRTKDQALLDIITAKPHGKFIVFSNYDRTFDAIQHLLFEHGITCRMLKGTPAAFRKILAEHEAGRIKVLLMNSRFDGAGHSMQWVTDAITYHRLSPETLEQVTGRGMRPGRTLPLYMHHLRWPCEV